MISISYQTIISALIAVFVSMETTGAVIAWPCPWSCSCDFREQTVECLSPVGYTSMPYGLPADVRTFTMADQNITVISALSFANLANLRKVEIVRSNIRDLEDNALLMAPKLRRFNFSTNYLNRIPRAVSGLIKLKDLVLRDNAISVLLAGDLQNLTNLRNLDLSKNIISTLPPGFFDSLVNLRTLNLSCNVITSIHDGTFMHLTRLEDLYFSNNRIEELSPSWMDNLQSLWTLQMNGAIRDPSQSPHMLPEGRNVHYANIQHLAIAHNGIRSIPCSALMGMPNLALLDLSYNSITNITNACFDGRVSSMELRLSNNRISNIERFAFYNATGITTLNLSNNYLHSFIGGTFWWPQVQFLYVDQNKFKKLTNETFEGAYYLKSVFMRGNAISHIPGDAFYLNNFLQIIDFRENNLTSIQDTFVNMSFLSFLALSNNDISYIIPNAFEGTAMQLIYLNNNSLTTLPQTILNYIPNLMEITLYGNPWHCDCKIRYLSEAMNNVELKPYAWYDEEDRLVCTSPRAFRQKRMSSVKSFQMICTTYASALAIQLIVGLSLSAVAISTALYVVQLYCKAKKLERNGAESGKCLS